ncbi:MAG TPA: hypothetical protein VFU16_08340 [Solirubrobacterales bacterium]|nr:hypothetical protein [Solirubrobacterales bacterium]
MRFRATLTGALACALAALSAPVAVADPANFAGISADGGTVFFTTTEKLVPGDTDTRQDVYERSYDEALDRYVTRLVSTGPTGGNDSYPVLYNGASADGTKAFFSTDEQLVGADKDRSEDIYVRSLATNTTALVSAGDPGCASGGCGGAEIDASFSPRGVMPTGDKVFFRSSESLDVADTDAFLDLYVRDLTAGTTTLVSRPGAGCPGCGTGNFAATFRGASADGTKAFFTTDAQLDVADTDALLDIYRRDLAGGQTTLVSTPGTCPAATDCSAVYGGVSADGAHAYFETNERLVGADEDDSRDVYEWSGGEPTLVSTGPAAVKEDRTATFSGASFDSARIYFETDESLVAADNDSVNDVYERSGGATALISLGPAGGNAASPASFAWVSPDGSTDAVLFATDEALVSSDEDAFQDVYARTGGTVTLRTLAATGGNGPSNASFAGASDDGQHVFVVTPEPLVPAEDTDTGLDVYELTGGVATLVSTGPLGGKSSIPAGLPNGAVAADGSHAFFITEERLTEGDPDAENDVYDYFSGGTLLASTGNTAPIGPPTPTLTGTDPASPGASLTPRIKGQAQLETAIKLYATSDCSGVPVATGTSAQLDGTGIEVLVASGSSNSFRATATDANGDTSPCSASVAYTQQNPTPPPDPDPDPDPGTTPGGGSTPPPTGSGGSSGGGGKGKGGSGVVFVTPDTKITFAPAGVTRVRRPVFRFTDPLNEQGSSFKCKLDREAWRNCGSPLKVRRLKPGRHKLVVRAVNALGVRDPAPASRSFKVVK